MKGPLKTSLHHFIKKGAVAIFDIATMTYRLIGPVVGQAFHDGLKLKS